MAVGVTGYQTQSQMDASSELYPWPRSSSLVTLKSRDSRKSNCYSDSAHNVWEEDSGSKMIPCPPEIRGKEKHPSLGERFGGDAFSEEGWFKTESKGLKPKGDMRLRKESCDSL